MKSPTTFGDTSNPPGFSIGHVGESGFRGDPHLSALKTPIFAAVDRFSVAMYCTNIYMEWQANTVQSSIGRQVDLPLGQLRSIDPVLQVDEKRRCRTLDLVVLRRMPTSVRAQSPTHSLSAIVTRYVGLSEMKR